MVNLQIGKIAFGPDIDPEADPAGKVRTVFEIIDDEDRLAGIVDEEAGLATLNLDSHGDPFIKPDVDVRLILTRRFFAQSVKLEIGV